MTNTLDRVFKELFPSKADGSFDTIHKLTAILNADSRHIGEEALIEALCEGYCFYEESGASEGELRRIKDHIEEHFGVPINWDDVPTVHSLLQNGYSVSSIAARLRAAQKEPLPI